MNNQDAIVAINGAFATPKQTIISQQKKIIAIQIKEKAKQEQMLKSLEPESAAYKQCQENIKKCDKKITECNQLIFVMESQLNIQTNARFRIF